MTTFSAVMQACHGRVREPDQGILKDCPLRNECARYRMQTRQSFVEPGYDFDDEECGVFIQHLG